MKSYKQPGKQPRFQRLPVSDIQVPYKTASVVSWFVSCFLAVYIHVTGSMSSIFVFFSVWDIVTLPNCPSETYRDDSGEDIYRV